MSASLDVIESRQDELRRRVDEHAERIEDQEAASAECDKSTSRAHERIDAFGHRVKKLETSVEGPDGLQVRIERVDGRTLLLLWLAGGTALAVIAQIVAFLATRGGA